MGAVPSFFHHLPNQEPEAAGLSPSAQVKRSEELRDNV